MELATVHPDRGAAADRPLQRPVAHAVRVPAAFPLDKWFDHPTIFGLDARTTMYVGFIAVLVNVLVTVVVTLILRAAKTPDGVDLTTRDDYFADEGDPRVGAPTVDELAGVRS